MKTGQIIIKLREEKYKREAAEKQLGHELDAMHIKRSNEVQYATHKEEPAEMTEIVQMIAGLVLSGKLKELCAPHSTASSSNDPHHAPFLESTSSLAPFHGHVKPGGHANPANIDYKTWGNANEGGCEMQISLGHFQ